MSTRQHFEMMALLIKRSDMTSTQKFHFAKNCAKEFEKQNPRFDKQKFMTACEISLDKST